MEAFTLDSTEIIVLATAGGLFLIQIIYYLCLYNRIHARSRAVKQGDTHFTQELPPISVIICAREESENLRRFPIPMKNRNRSSGNPFCCFCNAALMKRRVPMSDINKQPLISGGTICI